ncbi:hypothetical protein ACHAWF_017826 [Thalassiosira exigua]
MTMSSFLVAVAFAVGHSCRNGGGAGTTPVLVAGAAIPPPPGPPPSSPPSPSQRRRAGLLGTDYRRDEDVPILGNRSFRPSGRWRRRSGGGRRRGDDVVGGSDEDSDDGGFDPSSPFWDRDDYFDDERRYRRTRRRRGRRRGGDDGSVIRPLDSFRRWTSEKTGVRLPRVNVRFDPTTALKVRKSWPHLVPGLILHLGADLETHRLGRGRWRVRGCVEDKLFGGRFSVREARRGRGDDCDAGEDEGGGDGERTVLLEYSKSWRFAGSGSSGGTRCDLRGSCDLATGRCRARFGFRAEPVPLAGAAAGGCCAADATRPGRRGLVVAPTWALDGEGRTLLEAKARVDLPAPEFVVGADFDGRSSTTGLGVGVESDVDVDVEEVNLIFCF